MTEKPAMTHRQRAITAITGGIPDHVPTFELVFHETERDFGGRTFFGTPFEPDATGMGYTDIVRYNAQLYVDVARRFDHSIIFVNSQLGSHEPPGQDLFSNPSQGVLDTLKAIREIDRGEHLLTCHNDPTFMIPFTNAEEFCCNFLLEPELMHEQARKQVDQSFDASRKLMAAGADGFILCCDYCTNQGPYISPALFSEFVAPYLKECVAEFKRQGAYVIKHTDGNIMPVLDDLVAAEPHALHSIDPMAGRGHQGGEGKGGRPRRALRQCALRVPADGHTAADPRQRRILPDPRQAGRRLCVLHLQLRFPRHAAGELRPHPFDLDGAPRLLTPLRRAANPARGPQGEPHP